MEMTSIPFFKKLTVVPQKGVGHLVTIEMDRAAMFYELAGLPNRPSEKIFCKRIQSAFCQKLENESDINPDDVKLRLPLLDDSAYLQVKVPPESFEQVMGVINSMVRQPEKDLAWQEIDANDSEQWQSGDYEAARYHASRIAADEHAHPRRKTVPSISLKRSIATSLTKDKGLRVDMTKPNDEGLCQDIAGAVLRKLENMYSCVGTESDRFSTIRNAVDMALEEYVVDSERRATIVKGLTAELSEQLRNTSIQHTPHR